MTTLCPAVEEKIKLAYDEGYMCCYEKDKPCYHIGLKEGATLQREHDLKEFERILVEYFGKDGDGKWMLEKLNEEKDNLWL